MSNDPQYLRSPSELSAITAALEHLAAALACQGRMWHFLRRAGSDHVAVGEEHRADVPHRPNLRTLEIRPLREVHVIGEPMHQKDLMRRNLEWFARWIPAKKKTK